MSQVPVTRSVVVSNRTGVHARAATLIAEQARQFADCQIELIKDRQRVKATDVLQILALGADPGVQMGLEAVGPRAEQALDALTQLFNDKFGE